MWAKKPVSIMSRTTGRQGRRLVHTENSRSIRLNGRTVGEVIQTSVDKKKTEEYDHYRTRGMQALVAQIPKDLHKKELLAFKLNLTAVDPESKEEAIAHFEIGHVASALVRVSDEGISFEKDSIISKTMRSGFEDHEDYVSQKFISQNYPPPNYPIKEYYMFIDPAQFGDSTADIYRELAWRVRFENRPYNLYKDACGHAVHEALTGEKLGPRISAQTALQKTIAKLASSNPVLQDVLNKTMRDLGMNKSGFDVGQEFLEYRALKNLPRPTPGSS